MRWQEYFPALFAVLAVCGSPAFAQSNAQSGDPIPVSQLYCYVQECPEDAQLWRCACASTPWLAMALAECDGTQGDEGYFTDESNPLCQDPTGMRVRGIPLNPKWQVWICSRLADGTCLRFHGVGCTYAQALCEARRLANRIAQAMRTCVCSYRVEKYQRPCSSQICYCR